MFEAIPVAMSLSRLDDCSVTLVNEAYTRSFGVSRQAVIGRMPADAGIVFEEGVRERCFELLRVRSGEVEGIELEAMTPLGPKVFALWSRIFDVDGVPHVLSTFIDTTQQRRAIKKSREATERFRQLAESINEVFWLTNPDNSTMFYVSPAYERVFGRSCAALYANPRDWLSALHPDDLQRMTAASQDLASGPQENLYRVIVNGKVRSIRVATFPVRDAAGNVIRIAGVGEDRTEQLHLEDQVRQTQKLESVGLLAGGVAHDFNNVLAVIGANAGMLAELIPPTHPDRELVDEIEAAVRRASSLTRQLLAFSRKQVIEPVVLDLNAAIVDTRKMLRRMVGEDVVIETSLEPELGCARIDAGYFVQVLMNLAVNSRDAMPRGGKLTITTRNAGDFVTVEIADTGSGMSADVKARVFEPFFTTKEVGKGTGLGLSMVFGIVQQAGGQIAVDSEVGQGTTIRISLPRVEAPMARPAEAEQACDCGSEKIILVDDDVFVRKSTSRALRSRGYTVLEASDASAALRLLQDHGREISLLVTDVVMPGVDGRELAEAARRNRPTLDVLYMSGYTDDAVIRHGLEHDRIPFIEKPFKPQTIASKVRHLLDRRRDTGAQVLRRA